MGATTRATSLPGDMPGIIIQMSFAHQWSTCMTPEDNINHLFSGAMHGCWRMIWTYHLLYKSPIMSFRSPLHYAFNKISLKKNYVTLFSDVRAQRVIMPSLTKCTPLPLHPVHWLSQASDKPGKITLAAVSEGDRQDMVRITPKSLSLTSKITVWYKLCNT